MKEWLDLARGLVRPICTVGVVGAIIGFIATATPIPDPFWGLAGTITAWWFQSRKTA